MAARVADVARRAGDRGLLLDALRLRYVASLEGGVIDDALATEVAELAAELGRWPLVASVRINQAALLIRHRPAEAWRLLDEAELHARARGLFESQAWIGQSRAEAMFFRGDWDAAVRFGLAALDIAESHGYDRAAVRTWFVLGPIAAYRRDADLLARMGQWLDAHPDLPDSPYGRLMRAVLDRHVASLGDPLPPPDPAWLRESWLAPLDDSAVVAERDGVFEAWLAAEMTGHIRDALDAVPPDPPLDAAATGDQLLRRSRLARADGAPAAVVEADVRAALAPLRTAAARWWVAQALTVLEAIGAATPDERRERAEIESQLRGGRIPGAGFHAAYRTPARPTRRSRRDEVRVRIA